MSYNYNPSSKKAEEFINHEEILETLSYAEKNKNNVELIDRILAKARLRKGLSTVRRQCFLTVRFRKRWRRSLNWHVRSSRISTETGSSCLRRCICRITA